MTFPLFFSDTLTLSSNGKHTFIAAWVIGAFFDISYIIYEIYANEDENEILWTILVHPVLRPNSADTQSTPFSANSPPCLSYFIFTFVGHLLPLKEKSWKRMSFWQCDKSCLAFYINLYSHMGQFLQGGKNGHLMSFFFKSRASVWPNLMR